MKSRRQVKSRNTLRFNLPKINPINSQYDDTYTTLISQFFNKQLNFGSFKIQIHPQILSKKDVQIFVITSRLLVFVNWFLETYNRKGFQKSLNFLVPNLKRCITTVLYSELNMTMKMAHSLTPCCRCPKKTLDVIFFKVSKPPTLEKRRWNYYQVSTYHLSILRASAESLSVKNTFHVHFKKLHEFLIFLLKIGIFHFAISKKTPKFSKIKTHVEKLQKKYYF